jgi:hypothetical protein
MAKKTLNWIQTPFNTLIEVVGMKSKINLLSLVFLSFLLIFAYTNCEELGETKTPNLGDTTQLSNGEGYSGVQYNSFDTLNSCFTSIMEPVSTVTIINGVPHLTRENCQDITPRAISESIIEDHNREVALYNQLLFDRSDFNASEIFCRGNRIDDRTGNREVADIQIRRENGEFFGTIKLGIYDSNSGVLIESAQSENYNFEKIIASYSDGTNIINYRPVSPDPSKEDYHMGVRKDKVNGTLFAIIRQKPQINPGDTPPSIDSILEIELMKCYMHEDFPGSGGTTVYPTTGPRPTSTPPGP